MMPRIVKPEWLDQLSPDDPQAIASRADLRRINRLMGHASRISHLFFKHTEPQTWYGRRMRIADLGGGDGTLLLRLAREWSARGILAEADIIDARSAVSIKTADAFCKLGWSVHIKTADALHWARSWAHHRGPTLKTVKPLDPQNEIETDDQRERLPYDIILCNLFLHHFKDAELAELLAGVANGTSLFIACEPHRSSLGLWGVRALRLIRCTAVTLHDARASVHAGFAGEDLSRLWPHLSQPSAWSLAEGRQFFSHYFIAKRR